MKSMKRKGGREQGENPINKFIRIGNWRNLANRKS